MLAREVLEVAMILRRVLRRTDDDAIRLAACLSPDERDQVDVADSHRERIVAIAGIVCRAQMRTDRRQAMADAVVHQKLIDRAVPVPSGAEARGPRTRLPAVHFGCREFPDPDPDGAE